MKASELTYQMKITYTDETLPDYEIPDKVRIDFFNCEHPAKKFSELDVFKKQEFHILVKFFNEYNWHQTNTAKALGITLRQLQYKIKFWGFRVPNWKVYK